MFQFPCFCANDISNMTDQAKAHYLTFFFVFSFQLPRLLESDAIVRYHGLQKGQVVKITFSDGVVDLVPLSITFARLEERNRGMFAIIVF
jgi:hypothetical protein